jgi:hypothetical protein
MNAVNRRRAMTVVATTLAGTATLAGAAPSDKVPSPKLWTLEGELKVHPKYLYRYFLEGLGNGQSCGLFGSDHGRESDKLARIKPSTRVRVKGTLGTEFHSRGTRENPSPFPETWLIYMDVHEVEEL